MTTTTGTASNQPMQLVEDRHKFPVHRRENHSNPDFNNKHSDKIDKVSSEEVNGKIRGTMSKSILRPANGGISQRYSY
jgi:hypothetical protein